MFFIGPSTPNRVGLASVYTIYLYGSFGGCKVNLSFKWVTFDIQGQPEIFFILLGKDPVLRMSQNALEERYGPLIRVPPLLVMDAVISGRLTLFRDAIDEHSLLVTLVHLAGTYLY